MAEAIKLSEAMRAAGIVGTASPVLSTVNSGLTRLNDTQLAELERVAAIPLPALPPCDERHFTQCLRVMTAALPRQGSDDLSGELFIAAYKRKLGHMPKDQINYITDQALERCKWFPTIAECMSIGAEWERNDEAVRNQANAIAAIGREKQQRMEEAMQAMRDGTISQSEIDALPPRWQSIGETRGYLRRGDDGGYALRPPLIVETVTEGYRP